jgi:hypothetical protein
MKFSISLLSFLFLLSCKGQQTQADELQTITYTEQSRGYFFEVILDRNNYHIRRSAATNPSISTSNMPAGLWKKIEEQVGRLELKTLPSLEAPSADRASDRAAIAGLRITSGSKTYESNSFDAGYPPESLKPLVEQILQLAKTVE